MSFDDQKAQDHKDWVISEKYGGSQVVFNRESRSNSRLSETSKKSIAITSKLYGRRWMMLVLYYWSMFANSIPYEVVQPIAVQVGLIYDIDSQIVTLALTLYMAMHPIFSFYCAQVIVQRGWAFSTNVGIILTILGCGIRLLVNKWGFFVILIGQILSGIGRPFIMNSQASIASNWFYPQSRTFIIAGLNILHTFSMVVSIAIPGSLIFKKYKFDTDNPEASTEEGKRLFYKVQWVEFLIVLTLLPCLLLLRNQPPSMPTKNHKIEEKAPFLETLRLLGANKKFLCILVPYSLYFGLFKSLINILSYILTPFDFTSSQISIASELPLFFALISTGMIPIIINKYKRHKLIVNFLLFCSSSLLVCIVLAAETESAYIVYIVTSLTGFFLMPIVPIMFELACDAIFPLGASFAVGGMYIGSTLTSVIGNQLLTLIIRGESSTKGSVILTIGIAVGLFVFGAVIFQLAQIRTYSKVKIESVESVQSLLKQRTESTLYENASLFQCSMNIGLVGDTPIIDLNVNRDGSDLSEEIEQPDQDYQEDYFLTDLRFVNGIRVNDRKNEQWIKIDQDFWLVALYEKHGEFITSIRQSKSKLSGDDLLPELESNCKYIEICKGDNIRNQTFQVKDYDNEQLPILIAEIKRDYPIINLKQVDHLRRHDEGFELYNKKVIIKIYKKKQPTQVAYKPQLIDIYPLQQTQLIEVFFFLFLKKQQSYANKAFPEYLKIIDTQQPPENQYYIFTNNIEGNYSYGYCLQFWEKASITQISLLKYFVKKHQIYFPKVICLLSKHKYADQFQWFLNRIYQIYQDQENKINLEVKICEKIKNQHYIIGLMSIQLPQPPASLYYIYQGGDLRFHQNQHYPLLSKNSLQRKIIHIYRSLLYEERIQFISKNYGAPYYFIDTFSSLLYPFEFNGNKISILPEDNFIHLNQLQPYMIGYKEKVPLPIQPQSDHVIVYTDRNIVNVYQPQVNLPSSLMDQLMQLSQFNNAIIDKNELSNSEVLKIKDIFLRFNLKLIKMCESQNNKQSEQSFIQQFKKSLMYQWLFEDRKNHSIQNIQNQCYIQYPDKFSFIDQCMKKLDHEPLYQSDGSEDVFEIKENQFLKLKKYKYCTFPTLTPYIEGDIFQTERWSEVVMAQIMELWFTFFIIYMRLKSNNLKNTKILEYAIVIVDKAVNRKIKLNPIIFIYLLEAQNIYKYQCHEWLPFILTIIKHSGHQIDILINQQDKKYPNYIQNDLCIIQEVDNLSLYFKAECKQCKKELEIENIVDQFERTYLESKIICQCKQEIDAQFILFEYNQESDTQRQNQFKRQDRFMNPLYLMRQLEFIINDKGHEYLISEQFSQEHHQIFHNIVAYFRLIRLKQFFLWDNEFFDSNIVKLSDGNQSYFNKRRNQKERDTFRTSMEEQFIQQADMSPSGSQCSSGQKQSENSYKDFRRFLNEYLNEPETKKIMIEKQYSHRSKQ